VSTRRRLLRWSSRGSDNQGGDAKFSLEQEFHRSLGIRLSIFPDRRLRRVTGCAGAVALGLRLSRAPQGNLWRHSGPLAHRQLKWSSDKAGVRPTNVASTVTRRKSTGCRPILLSRVDCAHLAIHYGTWDFDRRAESAPRRRTQPGGRRRELSIDPDGITALPPGQAGHLRSHRGTRKGRDRGTQ